MREGRVKEEEEGVREGIKKREGGRGMKTGGRRIRERGEK